MTIKPGDTVRRKGGTTTGKVLAVYGDTLWTILDGSDQPVTVMKNTWEKVEPFFEAGKTYRNNMTGTRFTVEYVSTRPESGEKVAYGLAVAAYAHFDEDYWTEEETAD